MRDQGDPHTVDSAPSFPLTNNGDALDHRRRQQHYHERHRFAREREQQLHSMRYNDDDGMGVMPGRSSASPLASAPSLSEPLSHTDVARRSRDIRRSYYKHGGSDQPPIPPPTPTVRPQELSSSFAPSMLMGYSLPPDSGIENHLSHQQRPRKRAGRRKVPIVSSLPPQSESSDPIVIFPGEETSVLSGWSRQQLLKKKAEKESRQRRKKRFTGSAQPFHNVAESENYPHNPSNRKASSGSRGSDTGSGSSRGAFFSKSKIKSLIRKGSAAPVSKKDAETGDTSFAAAVSQQPTDFAQTSASFPLPQQDAAWVQEREQMFQTQYINKKGGQQWQTDFEIESQHLNESKGRGWNGRVFCKSLRSGTEGNKLEEMFSTNEEMDVVRTRDLNGPGHANTFPPSERGVKQSSFYTKKNGEVAQTDGWFQQSDIGNAFETDHLEQANGWFQQLTPEAAGHPSSAKMEKFRRVHEFSSAGYPETNAYRNKQLEPQGVSARSLYEVNYIKENNNPSWSHVQREARSFNVDTSEPHPHYSARGYPSSVMKVHGSTQSYEGKVSASTGTNPTTRFVDPTNRSSYLSEPTAAEKDSTPRRITVGMYNTGEQNEKNSPFGKERRGMSANVDSPSSLEKISKTSNDTSESPTSVMELNQNRGRHISDQGKKLDFKTPPRMQPTVQSDDIPSDEEGEMIVYKNKDFCLLDNADLSVSMSMSEMTDPAIWASEKGQRERKNEVFKISHVQNNRKRSTLRKNATVENQKGGDSGQCIGAGDKNSLNRVDLPRNVVEEEVGSHRVSSGTQPFHTSDFPLSSHNNWVPERTADGNSSKPQTLQEPPSLQRELETTKDKPDKTHNSTADVLVNEHKEKADMYQNTPLGEWQNDLRSDTSESVKAREWLDRRRAMESTEIIDEQRRQLSSGTEIAGNREWQSKENETMREMNPHNYTVGSQTSSPSRHFPSDMSATMSASSSTWFSAYGNNKDFIEVVAAVVIQTTVRRFIASSIARERVYAVHIIQAAVCRWMAKREKRVIHDMALRMYELAAIRIQALFRGWWVRDCLQVDHYCATLIQRTARGYLGRTNYQYDLFRIAIAQSVVRMFLAMHSSVCRLSSVIRIQAVYRGFRTRKFFVEEHAATRIQTLWRSYDAQMNFMHSLADILITQSVVRRWLTLRLVQPYMQSKQMDGKECVIFDDNSRERNEREGSENDILENSSVDTNNLLLKWRTRDSRRNAASVTKQQATPLTHPRRERFRK